MIDAFCFYYFCFSYIVPCYFWRFFLVVCHGDNSLLLQQSYVCKLRRHSADILDRRLLRNDSRWNKTASASGSVCISQWHNVEATTHD